MEAKRRLWIERSIFILSLFVACYFVTLLLVYTTKTGTIYIPKYAGQQVIIRQVKFYVFWDQMINSIEAIISSALISIFFFSTRDCTSLFFRVLNRFSVRTEMASFNPAKKPKRPTQINSLTSMRGLAAIGVVLYHVWIFGGEPAWASPLVFANAGVAFFFVLSSYLLVSKWLRGDYTSLQDYYLRRIFRTFPLYYITMFVAAFILGVYAFHLLDLTFLQEYFPSTYDPAIFWTLCIEEGFYFTLPLSMKYLFSTKRSTIVSAIINSAFSVVLVLFIDRYAPYLNLGLPEWFVAYCFGALLAHGIRLPLGKIATAGIFILVWIFEIFNWFAGTTTTLQDPIWVLYLSFTFYLVIMNFESSSFLNRNRLIIYLGTISYSVYIWHQFVMLWVIKTFFPGAQPSMALTLLGVTIGLGVAILSYYVIEQPFRKLGQRISKSMREREKLTPITVQSD